MCEPGRKANQTKCISRCQTLPNLDNSCIEHEQDLLRNLLTTSDIRKHYYHSLFVPLQIVSLNLSITQADLYILYYAVNPGDLFKLISAVSAVMGWKSHNDCSSCVRRIMLKGLDSESWHQHLQLDQDKFCCLQHMDIAIITIMTAMLLKLNLMTMYACAKQAYLLSMYACAKQAYLLRPISI